MITEVDLTASEFLDENPKYNLLLLILVSDLYSVFDSLLNDHVAINYDLFPLFINVCHLIHRIPILLIHKLLQLMIPDARFHFEELRV